MRVDKKEERRIVMVKLGENVRGKLRVDKVSVEDTVYMPLSIA